ncbi:phage holin family protein [Halalkalibacter urbisdiaboli]|uniref:phage holin family protein n=1 Tax=Halalkalibacter urbisdiaboli TaxID=1960589 RepID=UPI000B441E2A|nr:phage holin family protein [Halalkalibacter urbisdiaboli]
MRWIIGWLLNAGFLLLLASMFTGFYLSGFGAALIASLLLSIVNAIVRPILVVLTLPITVVTLGLFLFVISAITLMLTASLMGSAFNISGFGMALLAAILITIVQTLIIKPIKKKR